MILAAYIAMLIFDAALFAGTAWLVGWHGWSPWWFLLAVLIASGSGPARDGFKEKKG